MLQITDYCITQRCLFDTSLPPEMVKSQYWIPPVMQALDKETLFPSSHSKDILGLTTRLPSQKLGVNGCSSEVAIGCYVEDDGAQHHSSKE